eukprot:TRINITY_DN2337_c0_g1_i1.p1 TRINITY_DN2337_c0_g1~~TRINITY_DN2337_c0_g1_i1.p1  ORF type:complete len:310 (-),score=54.53 TRINITY_DN2337_c0_g1_i1:92-1021(-)
MLRQSQSLEPVILIIGATGHVGKETLIALRKDYLCAQYKLRATIRTADPQMESMLDTFGADTSICDLDQPATVQKSVGGASKAFLILPNVEHKVQQCKVAVDALKSAGVKHFVFQSMIGCDQSASIFARQFRECEDYIRKSGLTCTILRTALFQESFFSLAIPVCTTNELLLPIEKGEAINSVSIADIGEVAANVLLGEIEPHANKTYNIGGDEDLNGDEIATRLRKVSGRTIEFTPSSVEDTVRLYLEQGYDEFEARGTAELYGAFSKIKTESDTQKLLGRPPRKFEETMNSHKDHFTVKGMRGVLPL